MKILDILDEHAAALLLGQDNAPALLERYPAQAADLGPLFDLARALKSTLVPVMVSPHFRQELGAELSQHPPGEASKPKAESRPRVWLTVAAAGSILSVLGLVLFLLRRLRGAAPATPAPSGAL